MQTLDELFEQVTVELRAGNKLKTLKPLIDSYSGSDWKNFKFFSPAHYTRNTVLLNDVLEIAILCWEVNQGCPIHDHPDKGCLVRIMQGKLKETKYELQAYPVYTSAVILNTSETTYLEGGKIIHDLFNYSGQRAVSLNLYSQPNYKPNYY